MHSETLKIKNVILDKILLITIAFIAFPLFFSLIKSINTGWMLMYSIQIIVAFCLIIFFLLKNKIHFSIRVHAVAFLFVLQGIAGFYNLGFDSFYYYCLISIIVTGGLIGLKNGLLYLAGILLALSILSAGHMLGYIDTSANIALNRSAPSYWYAQITEIGHVSAILLVASKEMYANLTHTIKEKINAELALTKHKEKLEIEIKNITDEQNATNEELTATNEELTIKNDIIYKQNDELIKSLTDLRDMQSQLVQSEKMASLGILTAGIAHEINNPLNFIMGGYVGLQNLIEGNKHLPQKEKHETLLNGIKTGIERISEIINSLNQFSRTNDENNEICKIHQIINNCLLMLHNKLKNNIEVSTQFHTTALLVPGNTGKLHQLFLNILYNSCQAIEKTGNIHIETSADATNAIIKITDNGNGIKPEHLSQITDPFFTTKDPGKGTGLGLAISYSIIKEHNGKIFFSSEYTKQTTVEIRLPIYNE